MKVTSSGAFGTCPQISDRHYIVDDIPLGAVAVTIGIQTAQIS